MKMYWMHFYPKEFSFDVSLRRCSRSARSLWIDLLGIMHSETPVRGILSNRDGSPMTSEDIATIFGDSTEEVEGWLSELERNGVFDRDADGVVHSRRMLREAGISAKKRKAANARWRGKRQKNHDDECNAESMQVDNANMHALSGSGSGSRSSSKRGVQRGDVDRVVSRYLGHHPKRKVSDKERALVRARLEDGYTADDLIEAIDGNMASAWHQGRNDRGKAYDKLNLILRDASHVDEFREMKKPRRDPSELPKLTMPEWARNV